VVPVVGWVSRINGPDLEIRLRTGPRFNIPRRDDLRWGESVRVFYDYDNMRPGQILSLEQLALMREEKYIPWGDEDNPWDEAETMDIINSL
jgi:hypothetical protein